MEKEDRQTGAILLGQGVEIFLDGDPDVVEGLVLGRSLGPASGKGGAAHGIALLRLLENDRVVQAHDTMIHRIGGRVKRREASPARLPPVGGAFAQVEGGGDRKVRSGGWGRSLA